MRTRVLTVCLLGLALTAIHLSLAGEPRLPYFLSVALHPLLGLALTVPAVSWWWKRRADRKLFAAGWVVAGGVVAGVALIVVGNTAGNRTVLWAHVAASLVGAACVAAALSRRHARLRSLGLAATTLIGVAFAVSLQPEPVPSELVNPAAPETMADEAMGGADGPFFPSSVRTAHGGPVPSSVYLKPESCARSSCHPDVYDQWESSAHHFSSFNNQWYRKSIEYMQEVAGVEASKWCGGCHDPAVLQSGLMDTPIQEIVHTEEAQAGLTCTACHMISAIDSTMGQGDYEITVPALHDLATSENALLTAVHDLLVRLDPEPHKKTFIKPFFRGPQSAAYCSTCHKVHLDVPVNGYRWIRGFNEYDNWQASGVSGYGARSFYYPPAPRNCVDCHMPHVGSDDAGSDDGVIRSHDFAAANTATAVAAGDEEQVRRVTEFLQANQVTVDIFAMTEARPSGEDSRSPALDGPALATTFAIGEEQGMAVGRGGATAPAEVVLAPLDRIPASVRRGESTRIDVVVRTRGVGHFFPGGTVDAYDCWLELKAVDDRGRTVFWSGAASEDGPVEPGAHFYRALLIDAHGNPIDKRNAWASRATVYVRLIPPGAADTVRFRLDVPEDAGERLTLTAKLNYRKFSWFNTQFSFAGEPTAATADAPFTRDYDDREFAFTGDLADVSAAVPGIPKLPIVVMAEDTVELAVLDTDEVLPEMAAASSATDRERWNDYGIGHFLDGDLRGARGAFRKVVEIDPQWPDGWVNLARVALAEGDLDETDRVLAEALELAPDLARSHFFLGLSLKERGEYDRALEHLRLAAEQYPMDRVVRNQIGRVLFLQRDYGAAISELEAVLAIDPEDLMAHYTSMLAHRGAGDLERSAWHQRRYERFKADESSQILTREYLQENPHDNNERQSIHEHRNAELAAMADPVPSG